MSDKLVAWRRQGVPFRIRLISPECEILNVTFAMNQGWAKNREHCARPPHGSSGDKTSHEPPMVDC
jgi:hypothetical protein